MTITARSSELTQAQPRLAPMVAGRSLDRRSDCAVCSTALRILHRSRAWVVMTACATCGADPCANPGFCALCRDADARKGEPPRCAPLRPTPPPMADLPKANLEGKSWKEIAADGPSWKQAALEYHHARGDRTLIVEIEPDHLKQLRRLMEPAVTLEQAYREITKNRPTPQVTVEAVILTVRERGLAALKEPANVERLERCDAAAKAEIERRIAKLRKD